MTSMHSDRVPLAGGGDTGRLVRETDWSRTFLGDRQTWPQSLRSSLSLILNVQGIAALCWGPEQRLLYNDACGKALGDRHPRAFGRSLPEVLPDVSAVLGPRLTQVLRTGEGFAIDDLTLVMPRHGRDEKTVWTCNFSPIQDEAAAFVAVLLLATETTDRKKADRRARQTGTRLEAALGLARLGTFAWNIPTGDVELDARSREIFALPQDREVGISDIFARLAPEEVDRIQAETMAAIGVGVAFDTRDPGPRIDFHCDIVHPDGSRRSVRGSGSVIQDPDDGRRMLGSFQDVTDLKQAEVRLRTQEAELERRIRAQSAGQDRMWEASPDLMLVIDFKGVFRRVNPAWRHVLGYTPDELVGHHVNEFVVPQDHMETIDAYTEAAGGGLPRIVNRYRHKDGSTRQISWTAAPAGDLTYATGRDVTMERQRQVDLTLAQGALRQSQKLEAIGQLTGGVAHDFNNLLTVIRSSTELLKRPDLPAERRTHYITAISNTVDRAAKLTVQLLAFARRQALHPEVFAACDSVRSLSDMIETLTGSRIEIITELPEQTCYVNADANQFDTALVNLAVNARDAMNGRGWLTIRVEGVDEMPAIRAHAAKPGAFVAVSLSDTGSGIPADRLEQIFEPFFTTKAVGQGTGLGLSQVFGFVKQSGGEVMVRSEVGTGSTFTVYLPRVAAPGRWQEQVESEPLVDGHGTGVLVVEDNADVGIFVVQTLGDLGYAPVLAHDAEEALAELARDADRFDVVFTDVVMPGMDGIELAHEIRRRHHDLPVLLTSGYSHVLAQNGNCGFELLHKPYSVEQLSRLLRQVGTRQRRRRIVGKQV
ncbi:MAG TPA: PAS domain-containing protein [Variovorax sp.]|nr:PAS domain-containing protein [Variovorax sp.]